MELQIFQLSVRNLNGDEQIQESRRQDEEFSRELKSIKN